jgi:hypothetical protein
MQFRLVAMVRICFIVSSDMHVPFFYLTRIMFSFSLSLCRFYSFLESSRTHNYRLLHTTYR